MTPARMATATIAAQSPAPTARIPADRRPSAAQGRPDARRP